MKRPEVWKPDLRKGIQRNQKLGDSVLTKFVGFKVSIGWQGQDKRTQPKIRKDSVAVLEFIQAAHTNKARETNMDLG